jgi:hypothetical protein
MLALSLKLERDSETPHACLRQRLTPSRMQRCDGETSCRLAVLPGQRGWMGERIRTATRRLMGFSALLASPCWKKIASALLFLEIDGCYAALNGVDGQDLPAVVDDDKGPRRSTGRVQGAGAIRRHGVRAGF